MPYIENLGLALQVILALFGAFLFAFWISLVIWTFRDVRARSRDIFAQLLATLMVIIFNVPGLILYVMLRPPETLAETYERALEEEALLQDIEERYTCPGCKQKIRPDFQVCPSCRTRLKRPCPSCNRLLQLQWDVCPYCTAVVRAADSQKPATRQAVPSAAVTQPFGRKARTWAETTPVKARKVEDTPMPVPASYRRNDGSPVEEGEGVDDADTISHDDTLVGPYRVEEEAAEPKDRPGKTL